MVCPSTGISAGSLDGVTVSVAAKLADFERAHLVALQHIDVVDPWVVEHKTFIEKTYNDRGQQRTDGDIRARRL